MTDQEGDLRVWHIPQVPMKAFHWPVGSVQEGVNVCALLARYDLFQYENNVKPDYTNANGVQRYEDDGEGGLDWFDLDLEYELECAPVSTQTKTKSATPVRITDVKRGAVSPSPQTIRSFEAKIDSDPRWRQ